MDSRALPVSVANLRAGFSDYDTPELQRLWERDGLSVLRQVGELGVSRAMSVGTRQVLFQVVRAIGARSVLDIGTYVGTSALNFALAVGAGGRVVTVDVVDANAPDGFWQRHGRPRSPAELMAAAGVAERVKFVTARGVDYLRSTKERFGLICVDANTMDGADFAEGENYKTLRLSLDRLSPGGVMFFDDVFPRGEPVLPGGFAVRGIWQTLERAKEELGIAVHQIYSTPDGAQVRCAFLTR